LGSSAIGRSTKSRSRPTPTAHEMLHGCSWYRSPTRSSVKQHRSLPSKHLTARILPRPSRETSYDANNTLHTVTATFLLYIFTIPLSVRIPAFRDRLSEFWLLPSFQDRSAAIPSRTTTALWAFATCSPAQDWRPKRKSENDSRRIAAIEDSQDTLSSLQLTYIASRFCDLSSSPFLSPQAFPPTTPSHYPRSYHLYALSPTSYTPHSNTVPAPPAPTSPIPTA
jgi:hypothetical protein